MVVSRTTKEETVAYSSPSNLAPGAPVARNQLALVSFWLSLVFLVALLLNMAIAGIVVYPPLGSVLHLLSYVLIPLSFVLDLLGVVALFAAIVAGHRALRHARDFPPQQARRALAIAGLGLGYMDLALFLAFIGLAIWMYTHPIRMHLVF
jgi:hypothetical protein